MRSSILIRAEGGCNIGLGHVMRMIVLAKGLSVKYDVIFVSKYNENLSAEFDAGIEKIIENGFKIEKIDCTNYKSDLEKLNIKYNVKLFITDSYDVDLEYFKAVNTIFCSTAYIDDINDKEIISDIIINLNAYGETLNYEGNSFKLIGGDYCLIRDEFRYKKIDDKRKSLLITVGGSDKGNITKKILEITKDINLEKIVVIGNGFKEENIKELYDIFNSENIKFVQNPKYMSELMNKSFCAISACGSTIYELASMKIPTVGLTIAVNQEIMSKYMLEKEAILFGAYIDGKEDEFYECVKTMINNDSTRNKLVKNMRKVINTNGVENLKNKIIEIIES